MKNQKNKRNISRTSVMHYVKLAVRSAFFVTALILYVISRVNNTGDLFGGYERIPWILVVTGIFYAVEMLLRFFPSRLESPGCQKQFKRNFRPTDEQLPRLQSPWRTLSVALVWIVLNTAIGALYYAGLFDAGILVLISLGYGVCDMVCILFFCPFQTWFMKNRCCTDCRIYNWDFAMMFTPYVFIPHPYTWSLFAMSLVLLLRWEITVARHPERFAENTNACISCKNCNEKLCAHKTQLRSFIIKNKKRLLLKGNELLEGLDRTIKRRKGKK